MYISKSILTAIITIATTVDGALTRVNDFGTNPTNLQMNIYVPAKLADKPAVIIAVCCQFFCYLILSY